MKVKDYRFTIPTKDGRELLHLSGEIADQNNKWSTERHCNAEYELHIILSGTCSVDIAEQQHILNGPQTLLIAPGQYHNSAELTDNFVHFALNFSLGDDALAQKFISRIPGFVIFPAFEEDTLICKKIFQEIKNNQPYRDMVLQALCTELLAYIFRHLELTQVWKDEAHLFSHLSRTDNIDGYFGNNFAKDWDETDLAQKLHLSKRQLNRVLKDHYGMTFRQKRIDARMEHAKWLLRETDMPVSQIAVAEGYRSEAAFYKAFRNHYNTTPQAYRNHKRKVAP